MKILGVVAMLVPLFVWVVATEIGHVAWSAIMFPVGIGLIAYGFHRDRREKAE